MLVGRCSKGFFQDGYRTKRQQLIKATVKNHYRPGKPNINRELGHELWEEYIMKEYNLDNFST